MAAEAEEMLTVDGSAINRLCPVQRCAVELIAIFDYTFFEFFYFIVSHRTK